MANEYELLAEMHDSQTEVKVSISRMYQEDGNTGIEVVVEHESGKIIDVFQSKDLKVRYWNRGQQS